MASRTASQDSISVEKPRDISPGANHQVAEERGDINMDSRSAMPHAGGEKEPAPGGTGLQDEDGKAAPAEHMSAFQTVILTLALCVSCPPLLSVAG